MVKIVRDFFIKGNDKSVFQTLLKHLPDYLREIPGDEYNIIEEISNEEEERIYRKAQLKRLSTLKMLPEIVKDNLPKTFMDITTKLVEEIIFDVKNTKMQFHIECEDAQIYSITGTTQFIPMSNDLTKATTVIHLTIHNLEKYINKNLYNIIFPILEKKIPELFIDYQKIMYNDVWAKYKLLSKTSNNGVTNNSNKSYF